MKKNSNSAAGLSKPAKIAIAATAIVLLAAIIFGVIWTSLDRSYRYDQVDLTQFYADGKNPIDFETIKTLPIRLETDVSEEDITKQIGTNLMGLPAFETYKKKGPDSIVAQDLPYHDTVYLYYEVYRPTEADGGKDTLLMSNTAFHDGSKASVVHLGDNALNEVLEKWLLNYSLDDVNGEDKNYTTVDRYTHTSTSEPMDIIDGYTLVINVKGSYIKETTASDGTVSESSNVYVDVTNHHYQKTAKEGSYYQGASTVLSGDTAWGTTVKKADQKVIDAVNAAAAAFTKLGDKTTIEFKVDDQNGVSIDDSTQTTYDATFEVELVGMFLAERKGIVIDFDNDDDGNLFKGMTFSYTDESGNKKKIEDKTLKVYFTIESLVRLDKETVEALTDGNTAFTAPTEFGDGDNAENIAYANAYLAYIKSDLMNKSIEKIKKDDAAYLSTLKSALWKKIVKIYSDKAYITSVPEEERARIYKDTLAYHATVYQSYYSSAYKSVEEYILRGVYEEEADVSSLDKATQQKKVEEHINADIRESLCEKIILFTVAKEYGVTVSNSEWREYKEEFRASRETYYLSLYKTSYASTMSQGEIAILAADEARKEADAYTVTYYRECVTLEKVQDILVAKSADFPADKITWTLEGMADEEE